MTPLRITVFDDPVALLNTHSELTGAVKTRADILLAAEAEFVKSAREDVNFSDIAAKAGVKSSSLIQYHFKSVARLLRVSRDFRWVPINAYRQELINRFSQREWLSGACCFFTLVEPITWAAACAGAESNVARSIYLHQKRLMELDGAGARHGGRQVLDEIVNYIVNDRLTTSNLSTSALAHRAQLLSIGMPANLAAFEKTLSLRQEHKTTKQLLSLWRTEVEAQYDFACSLFEVNAPRPVEQLMQVSDELRNEIGTCPNWASVAHQAGVF